MPQFDPSSVHKATVTFSNPKSVGSDYVASLYMGAGWTDMASASFHLDAGQSKAIQFSVTMPDAEGTYPVYLDVFSNGQLIGAYKATEDVVIATLVGFTIGVVRLPGNVTHWRALIRSQWIPPGFSGYPGTLPEVDSGYLDPAERWRCPVDPWMDSFSRTLMVWGLELIWNEEHAHWEYDTVTNIIQLYGLHSGRDYTYNFVTHVLDGGVGDETLWWGYP